MLLEILQVAHFGEGVGPDHRADGDGVRGIEALHRLIGRQEGVDRAWSGTSMRSTAWVRMKPSTQTIVGTDSSSARRKATMWRSAASWFDSANSWIQPDSRIAIASE